jgi:acylphosphatase
MRIRGRVQGVSFRYYAHVRATSLGLGGWIRNCPDGSVEAVVEGADDAVGEFVAWARRGPSPARVESVDVSLEEAGATKSFEIRD